MKNLLILTIMFSLLSCFTTELQAQRERDTWVVGRNPEGDNRSSRLTFKDGELVKVDTVYNPGFLLAVTSYCDPETGEMLLYSNGFHLFDGNGEIINKDEILNPTYYAKSEVRGCKQMFGEKKVCGTRAAGTLVLLPLEDNRMGVVHQYPTRGIVHMGVDSLYYTELQRDPSENTWEIIKMNELIMYDWDEYLTHTTSLTAVRHGNGRDWWVLAGGMNTVALCKNESCFRVYVFLLSPEGLSLDHVEVILPGYERNNSIRSIRSSVDGSVLATVGIDMRDPDYKRYVHLYDFDRCDGTMSLREGEIEIGMDDLNNYGGIDVDYSATGRYLYVHNSTILVQYDLMGEEWWMTGDTVGVWSQAIDDSTEGVKRPTQFAWSSLAPDGKIYVSALLDGSPYMHVIHHPERRGAACEFEQNGLALPYVNKESVPLYMNYSLGALKDSPCDSLGLSTAVKHVEKEEKFILYPNPAQNQLKIKSEKLMKSYTIYSISGVKLQSDVMVRDEVDISTLPEGTYIIKIEFKDGSRAAEKFVKIGVIR